MFRKFKIFVDDIVLMIQYSIIIPHKNTPDLLQRCLDSIPRRDDVQVIVVDDNSDADKVDFEHFPGIDDERVEVYLTKEGKGAGYARNVGMSHAKGEWLIFADADDYFYTDNLSQLMDMDIPDEFDVVVWKSKYVYLDGTYYVMGEDASDKEDWELIKCNTTDKLYLNYVTPWAKMVRRRFLIKYVITFDEVRYGNDDMYSNKIGVNTISYLYVNSFMYCHERLSGSLMETVNIESLICRANVYLRKNKYLLSQKRHLIDIVGILYDICRLSYVKFIFLTLKEVRLIGLKQSYNDYCKVCNWFGISKIPFLSKIINMSKFKNYLRRRMQSFLGVSRYSEGNISYYRSLGVRIGDNVSIISPVSPVIFSSEPYLVSVGDNTTISFDVVFVTHDAATRVIRNLPDGNRETVMYGTISVGNNCFIGCRTTILPNVKIGDNAIIGAGSLVNRDIPSNVIAAGNPCKVICTLDEYREKHKDEFLYMVSLPYEKKKVYLMEKFDIK